MPLPIAMGAIEVTTNCNGCDQCHHHEASKLLRNKPLESEEEGRGNQLWSHKWPCQRARQERREGVMSITTKLNTQQQLLLQGRQSPRLLYVETNRRPFGDRKPQADRANACPWSPTTRASGLMKTKTQTTTTKITSKNCAINVHRHDNCRHSREEESHNDPHKFRR